MTLLLSLFNKVWHWFTLVDLSASALGIDEVDIFLRIHLKFKILHVSFDQHHVRLHELVDVVESEMSSDVDATHVDR